MDAETERSILHWLMMISVSRRRDIGVTANHQALTAISTESVCDANRALALPAGRSELKVALGAEVISRLQIGGTLWAANGERLAKQEVNHQPDGAGHKDDQHGPQTDIHSAAASVARDIADHEGKEGYDDSPREAPEETEPEGRHVVLMLVKVDVHNVLDRSEEQRREHYRPHWDQPNLFGDLGLLFVHLRGDSWVLPTCNRFPFL
jgi:hypothetical protein